MTVVCGRDAAARRGGRGATRLGRERDRLAVPSSPATTSTSSTSAPPATATPRSPSPPWRPASTCSARSRWPTPWPRRRRWSTAAERADADGVRAMVGLHLPPRPGDRPGPPAGGRGPHRRGAARPGAVPPGLDRRPGGAAVVAPGEGQGRLRRAGRHRRPHHRPDPVHHRRPDRRGLRPADHLRQGAPARHRAQRPLRHRRHRARRRSPSTTRRSSWPGSPAGRVGVFEATRFATGRKNGIRIEINGSRGSLAFDFEDMNVLQLFDATEPDETAGFRRILVTEPGHPYVAAWWPPGHGLGYEHALHPPGRRPGHGDRRGDRPAPDLRRRSAGAARAGRRRDELRHPHLAGDPRMNTRMSDYTPRREDKFSFGLWTVGWQGVDVFGPASRPLLDPVEATYRLAELGAAAVTFHDDDLVPDEADAGEHARALRQGARRHRPGRRDGDHQPLRPPRVQGGRAHRQPPRGPPLRRRQGAAQHRPGRRAWVPRRSSCGAAARVPSTAPARTSRPPSTATPSR